jgi:hypothetical protein
MGYQSRRKREGRARRHAYVETVMEWAARNSPAKGQVTELAVLHDADCGIFRGGTCRCSPSVKRLDEVRPGRDRGRS